MKSGVRKGEFLSYFKGGGGGVSQPLFDLFPNDKSGTGRDTFISSVAATRSAAYRGSRRCCSDNEAATEAVDEIHHVTCLPVPTRLDNSSQPVLPPSHVALRARPRWHLNGENSVTMGRCSSGTGRSAHVYRDCEAV